MKNYTAFILSIATVVAVGIGFSSCKEDEPPAKPKLSFAQSTKTVSEDDGTIEVEVVLDKAHSQEVRIEYNLGGTASDQEAVGTADADYEVAGEHGVVVIASGQTTGIIELEIYDDSDFEEDETIEISIMDVNTTDIELTTSDEIVITITNEDEQLQASFPAATLTVNEADGVDESGNTQLLAVTVQLDQAAPQDITLEYTLAGTAIDTVSGSADETPRQYWDYFINGVSGQLIVPSGATSANIEIQLYTDFIFEDDETIEITLTGTNAAPTNNKMTITVEQQNGKVIALLWNEDYNDVDMDMFLWLGEDLDNLDGILATALTPSTTPQQELIIIPSIFTEGITEAAFGLSYVYYEGTADPMNFEAHFVDFTDGALEVEADRDVFAATYTLANINKWDQSEVDPVVVQTFRIVNGAYVDLTEITVPASGSRMRTFELPKGHKRNGWRPSRPL